jgi:SAM-dependent methyltransferase
MPDIDLHPHNAVQAEYWNGPVGRRWRDHQERQDQVLLPVLERLVVAADARRGERVIDIGCGAGATAVGFALKVAPDGEVLAIDVSAPLIERARERVGDLPVRFVLADAAAHPPPPDWADLIVSRFGVMFFADPTLAFRNLRRGLRSGGRMALACWREAKLNPWIVVPLRAVANHAPPLPELGPEDPGPFSFADPARVRRIVSDAGFVDVDLEPHELELDIAVGRGLDTAVEAMLAIGPASRMLQDQSEDVRAAAAADIRAALAAHAQGDRVPLAGAIWIVTARNP